MTLPEASPITIIGAGFSGIGMALRLRQAGIDDFVILERASRIGGTWRDNTYPGCACDVPSNLYSFSFAPNPWWSRMFSPASEIQAYLLRLVEDHDLARHIHFDCALLGGRWVDRLGHWDLTTTGGRLRAGVLIAATGPLIEPALPALPGLETFGGATFHSSRWDHSHDITGRDVAVVGTGASAVQFLPVVQHHARNVTLFQRTAPWVLPRLDRRTTAIERMLFHRVPAAQRLVRGATWTVAEALGVGLVVDQRFLRPLEAIGRAHLRHHVRDPELRRKLTPHFRLGCKRILFSNEYYRALSRDNASVVTEPIARVTREGIVTGDGNLHRADTIIFGTGFRVPSGVVFDSLHGRNGTTLGEVGGADDIEAYLGTTCAGFPNLFVIPGPNTGLGHNSLLLMMEAQMGYVLGAIHTMRRENLVAVEVRATVQRDYNVELQRRSERTVWLRGGCDSWYLNRTGRNTTLWPGSTVGYRWRMRRFDAANYVLRGRDRDPSGDSCY